jgi:hypothetical protein
MSYETGQILNYFLGSIPFWVPAIIGLYLIVRRPSDLSLMAGILTLKPIVTTAIWLAIIRRLTADSPLQPAHFLSILPGASLTLIIVLTFRHLCSGSKAGDARVLLMLDCARWLNSFLYVLPYDNTGIGVLTCIFSVVGLALPTVFAFVALTLSQARLR